MVKILNVNYLILYSKKLRKADQISEGEIHVINEFRLFV